MSEENLNFIKFIRKYFYTGQIPSVKNLFFLGGKMGLEKSIPFVHSVDLVVVVSLTGAF